MSANVPRYARGDRAWGECARSGKRMLLRDMVEDPLTGLLVAPDWAEPPLMRPATDIFDGVALSRPAPDADKRNIGTAVYFGELVDFVTGDPPWPLRMTFATGKPTVVVH
jgi:hypothetical protein